MGFKTTNYEIGSLGITMDTAYAQITSLNVDENGMANCRFAIQKTRDNISKKTPLDYKHFRCSVDKSQAVHEQVYTKAKEAGLFSGWEDDINE